MSLNRSIANEGSAPATVRVCLAYAAGAAAGLTVVVVASSIDDTSSLGAPPFWPWLLTGLQVLALWSAGTGRWWGWLLGGSVQVPWIAYAIVTTQFGFIPGCLASSAVQLCSFCRLDRRQVVRRDPTENAYLPTKGDAG